MGPGPALGIEDTAVKPSKKTYPHAMNFWVCMDIRHHQVELFLLYEQTEAPKAA